MIDRRLILFVFLPLAVPAYARQRIQGYCAQGGQQVLVANGAAASTTAAGVATKWQQSYPSCTVTVYSPPGSTTVATIYADATGTAKSNPFTASTTGLWFFYVDPGIHVDLNLSGGGIVSPFTLGDYSGGETMFNVKTYGAVGDGVTNDRAAIVSAQTAAGTSGCIEFPASSGNYIIGTNLTLTNCVAIDGGILQVSGGVTLTISGPLRAPLQKVFAGSGTVGLSGVTEVYPDWFGAKCDNGTTDNSTPFSQAITASLVSGASHTVHVRSCSQGNFYQINVPSNGTGINLSASSSAATNTNDGFTLYGDGIDTSMIRFHASGTNNTGVGIDMSGAAYFRVQRLRLDSGASVSDTVRTLVLLGKPCFTGVSPCTGANIVFSGIGVFDQVFFGRFGDYAVFDLGAEEISFRDCQFPVVGTTTTATIVLSRANTAAITSPNVTLNSPADSMTGISFTGFGQVLGSNGPQAILLDVGSSGGIASISVNDGYFNLTNATGLAISSNGSGTSSIDRIECHNCRVEANGGAGTNQVFNFSAGNVRNIFFTGVLSSSVAQTAAEFVWANPLVNSYIDWNPNDNGAGPTTLISSTSNPGAKACIFKTSGLLSTLTGLADGALTGSWIMMGNDGIHQIGAVPGSGNYGIDAMPIGAGSASTGKFTSVQPGSDTPFTASPRFMWSCHAEQATAPTGAGAQSFVCASAPFDKAVTVTRFTVDFHPQLAGCTTQPVVALYTYSGGLANAISSLTISNATPYVDSGALSYNVPAGTALAVQISTASVGCTTNWTEGNATAEYKMQ